MTPSKQSHRLWQILNVLAAAFMWIAAAWPQITGQGRSAKEFSDLNDSLLVPFGAAFAIWLPIFVLCLVYAGLQALPRHKTRAVYIAVRGWTALAFICVGFWSITAYFAPLTIARWLTVLIFIPIIGASIMALRTLQERRFSLSRSAQFFNLTPIGLLAGWTSLAGFLNLTPLVINGSIGQKLGGNTGVLNEGLLSAIMLMTALIFAGLMIRYLGRIWAYAVPIVWGLSWLAYERLIATPLAGPNTMDIGYIAMAGAVLLVGLMFITPIKPHLSKRAP